MFSIRAERERLDLSTRRLMVSSLRSAALLAIAVFGIVGFFFAILLLSQ